MDGTSDRQNFRIVLRPTTGRTSSVGGFCCSVRQRRKRLAFVLLVALAFALTPSEATSARAAFPGLNGKIAFVRTELSKSGNSNIYIMNAQGSGQAKLTNYTTPRNGNFFVSSPEWSPDGKKIVYWLAYGDPGSARIYVMNADGSSQMKLPTTVIGAAEPTWSPDGKKIAFEGGASRTTESYAIYVMNADGSGETKVSGNRPDFAGDTSPAWAPDGKKIAFVADDINGPRDISVVNADGSGETRLTNHLYADYPAWSPDGKKIAFGVSNGTTLGSSQIYVMNADGSGKTKLTTTIAAAEPTWSPDGKKIAFASFAHSGGGSKIYVMNADGTGLTKLTDGPQDTFPRWQSLAHTGGSPRGGVPGPPQNVIVDPANGSAYVSWNPPSNRGRSTITRYNIAAIPTGVGQIVTGSSAETSKTVYGLAADCLTEYRFSVTATNAAGTGPSSTSTSAVRPSGFVSDSAPSLAIILLDGAPSTEAGGTYYPIPVSTPTSGVSVVRSYCPTPPGAANTMTAFPNGLHDNLWRWDEFPVSGGSSGSSPQNGTTCLGQAVLTNCLTARYASKGVVFFPYSYKGATLTSTASGPLFTLNQYGPNDSAGGNINTSIAQLDQEILSIHRVWHNTDIVVIGHSFGGLVAERWWLSYWHAPSYEGVTHVFSLDSPINGVRHTSLMPLVGWSSTNVDALTYLWNHFNQTGKAILTHDGDGSYRAVGAPDDPTYSFNTTPPFGGDAPDPGIFSQVELQCTYILGVRTGCTDSIPPNYISPCSATSTVDGITGHDAVKVCPGVINYITTVAPPD